MGWSRSKSIAAAAVALLVPAITPACGSGIPDPVRPNPELAALSVYVEPPDVAAETDECRRRLRSGHLTNPLRTQIATELMAAGMKVVRSETPQPDLRATTRIVLKTCTPGEVPSYAWWNTQADLLLHTGGVTVWHERIVKTFASDMGAFADAVAATLVRSALRSRELSIFANQPRTPTPASSAPAAPPPTAAPPPSHADATTDPARANALFAEGRQLVAAGQMTQACDKFGESLHADPAAGTLMNLADCEERTGRLFGAWTHWRQLLRALPETGDARRDHAQQRLDELESRLPRLTIRLGAGAPSGARISIDDFPVGDRSIGRAVFVGPGDHVILVEAPGRSARKYSVSLREGEKRELTVEPVAAAPASSASAASPPAAAPGSRPSPKR